MSLAKHERDHGVSCRIEEDCSEAVIETVGRARSVISDVVLSTWSDDVNAGMARTLARRSGCDLALCEDPGRGRSEWGPVPDNRWRQIRSSIHGLEHVLRKTGATHVVRQRTDQVIDVESIVAAVEREEGDPRPRSVGQADHVYVPGVLETVPFAVDDFYFAGTVMDVWRFFAAQWDLRHHYHGVDSVHADLIVKHIAHNLRPALSGRFRPFEFFPVVDARRDLGWEGRRGALGTRYLALWSAVLEHSVKPLPRHVYEGIVFRGVPYVSDFDRMFLEEWSEYRDEIGGFFRSRFPDAFTEDDFGALGRLLNYAPECALLHGRGPVGGTARLVHALRRLVSDRYRGVRV